MSDSKLDSMFDGPHGPLVFISHDTRDAKLAEAFSHLLKGASTGVLKSFRSSDKKSTQGIEFGVEWYPEIIKQIQKASDVVCLLTKNSIDRPWILFEAGMAKGKLDTPILGLALGVSLAEASSGPFAQFQNCGDDDDSLAKLVFQLVDRIPYSEPDEETIKFQIGKFKKSVKQILLEFPDDDTSQNSDSRDIPTKLFEEIKVMFKDLPSRIENNNNSESFKRKRRKFHHRTLEELLTSTNGSKISILVALSALAEYIPWIYDIGLETIRFIDSDAKDSAKLDAVSEFQDLLMVSTSNTTIHKNITSNDETLIFDKLPDLVSRYLENYLESKV